MSRTFKLNTAFLCLMSLFIMTLCGFSAPAPTEADGTENDERYEEVTIYVDGIRTALGYIISGETYMPVRSYCELLELSYVPDEPGEDWAFQAELAGAEISIPESGEYIEVSGRYFYLPNGPKEIGGEYSLPVVAMSKIIGAQVQWDESSESVDIDATTLEELVPGEEFYDYDDVYWLSRIISAESGNQPIDGMIGVGNVVLNRVADPSCPDTVFDVIFDTKYGVQFAPVETGAIYNEPNEQSVIAAKLCLDGYQVVDDALYFLNPAAGGTQWFRQTRTFVASIGDHDFYA